MDRARRDGWKRTDADTRATRPRARWRRLAAAAAQTALPLLALAVGCSSTPQLSDMPQYPPAEDFLALQAKAKAYKPPPKHEYYFNPERQRYLDAMASRVRAHQAELARDARIRAEYERRNRIASQAEWDALARRLAQEQALDAADAKVRDDYARRNRLADEARFQGYSERVERLTAEQQAAERKRRQAAERIIARGRAWSAETHHNDTP